MNKQQLSEYVTYVKKHLPSYLKEEGPDDKLFKIYKIILKYVKHPMDAMEELDAFISQGVDGFDDALYANLVNDPEFRSVYNIARKEMNELNENYKPDFDSKGYKMAQKVITQLQSSVFPKLDNDELYEFRQAIADAFNLKNL
jgi:hypothetical protein